MLKTSAYTIPGLMIRDHYLSCPVTEGSEETIDVFAREIVPIDSVDADLPMLVYLQGGPGFESPRPHNVSGWLQEALKTYRVLFLDQRGVGLSSPICQARLRAFDGPEAQAEYLTHFRADEIVRDAEAFRKALLGADKKWSILGQSFGGFCAVHYLSAAPSALERVLITGGLPPLSGGPDPVYRALYSRVSQRNELYFERFPMDRVRFNKIIEHLCHHEVSLPSGTRLTENVFKQIGLALGASDGFESIHYLLESAFPNGSLQPELNFRFLSGVDSHLPFNTNPIYAILHESIYCQREASNWSAERILTEFPEFIEHSDNQLMTGEMVFSWMFESYGQLQELQETANILAQKSDWPILYNAEVLSQNQVPCAAAVYYDDMYVELEYSMETAKSIRGLRTWVTNEYDHNGLRVDGARIFKRLLDLTYGRL